MSPSDSEAIAQPPSSTSLPSSFDDSPEFFEEARMQKLWRKIKQEPLIPIGCAATCYALYQATKSIRQGDHNQTNRMFRARIYAQGFTLAALVVGSIFYKDERLKRKRFEAAVEDKKAAEKREKWLRELEIRDEEERRWRKQIESGYETASEAVAGAKRTTEEVTGDVKKAIENRFSSKSISDQVRDDGWGPGTWSRRTKEAWRRL